MSKEKPESSPELKFEITTDEDDGHVIVHATSVNDGRTSIDVEFDEETDTFNIGIGPLGLHLGMEDAECLFQELGYHLREARGYPEGGAEKAKAKGAGERTTS